MQSISGWAKGHGFDKVIKQQKGGEGGMMYNVAEFMILRRIKQAIGLDCCQGFFYGAAPLKQPSVDYFASLDIPLMNCYGLSETCGTTTIGYINDFRLDYAGHVFQGGHIKIADQDDQGKGEITIAGRHIMMGYLKNEKATREVIDKFGYFKSGDQGKLD